ncbi:MAG: hypothetical protein Kilf2KO_40300 [Rhodospirillales bacterium]
MLAKIASVATLSLMLAACASSYEPVVDYKASTNTSQAYEQNLRECRALAEQGGSPVEDAAIGGVGGAAVGAAIGAISGAILGGGAGTGAAAGAAIGGTAGGAGGAVKGVSDQRSIVRECLRGRGYAVVD